MVIQYEKNAGLRQGLESLGASIGGTLQQALQQATAQRKGQYERKGIQTFLNDTLSNLGPDSTAQDYIQAFGQLSNLPGGQPVAQSLSPLMSQLIKNKSIENKPDESLATWKTLTNRGVDLGKYVPGTPSSVYQKIADDHFKEQKPDEGLATRGSYESFGYDLPEHIAGTKASTYENIVEKQDKIKVTKDKLNHNLGLVEDQLARIKSGKVGKFWAWPGQGQGRDWLAKLPSVGMKERAKFMQVGKGLIQAATPIIIRNRIEFETLSDKLMDPNLSIQELEGTYEGLRDVIDKELLQNTEENKKFFGNKSNNNFQQVAQGTKLDVETGRKIFESVGGDEQKAAELAKSLGYIF
jgi:hypothetical protein